MLFLSFAVESYQSGVVGRSGIMHNHQFRNGWIFNLTKSKHGTGEHVHPEIARNICLSLGTKVELFIKKAPLY
ncbi:hypothetical protein [Oceanobacillus jeddahense]|uniref:hypothetical protein n=1 Tax=Oceanobacillus jeddahense TaxID=1462527 RepID=UPI0011DE42A1|nr:hypothetical protein [Oceanobacillus jeddahense]